MSTKQNPSVEELAMGLQIQSLIVRGMAPAQAADHVSRLTSLPMFARGDHVELASEVIDKLGEGPHKPVFAEGELYNFDSASALWLKVSDEDLVRRVVSLAGAPVGNGSLRLRMNDILGVVRLVKMLASNPSFFDDAPDGVAFTNGFVRVLAGRVSVEDLCPEHRVRQRFEFDFVPSAWGDEGTAGRFVEFLYEVFDGDDDRDEKIALLLEFGGVCLIGRAPRFQQALILSGEGANGKSVVLSSIFEGCFPHGGSVSIPPQDFEQEYRRAMLMGARINIVNEIPERDLLDAESFKAIIAGDSITGRPIRQAPVRFRPRAGHVFAGNRLPLTSDTTFGFWRRLLVLTFNRKFLEHEQDPELVDKLTAEIPRIVPVLLDAASKVMSRGGYTVPRSSLAAVQEWRRASNTIEVFMEEELDRVSYESGMMGRQLYATYAEWCRDTGHRPMSSQKLAARLKELGAGGMHTKTGTRYPLRPKVDDAVTVGPEVMLNV